MLSKHGMFIQTMEFWLSSRWPADYKPTKHFEGHYGLVFVLEARISNLSPQKFCVKTVNPEKLKPDRDIKKLFEQEMRLWLSIPHHPNVLPALGLEFVPSPVDLSSDFEVFPLVRMPFCDASLSKCVDGEILMSPEDRLIMLIQVCSGLQWLYEHRIEGHGDLKPDNILLGDLRERFDLSDEEGYPSKAHFWQARIADFGWTDIWKKGGGTERAWAPYLAPERFRDTVVPEASDIFALGVIACELFSGKHPAGHATRDLDDMWESTDWAVWADSGHRHLDFGPASLRDLVLTMLSPAPIDRPSASDLKLALRDIVEREYGLNVAFHRTAQDDRTQGMDLSSHLWAVSELSRVGAIQLDASIKELEELLSELGTQDRADERWLTVASQLQKLLLRRAFPPDSQRVTELARMVLDRLLLEKHDAAGVCHIGEPAEITFKLVYEAFTNLSETTTIETDDPTLFMSYRTEMERIGLVVFNNLCQYWSERGVKLDEHDRVALLRDGSLRIWWSDYMERKGQIL